MLLRAGADPDAPCRDHGQVETPVDLALLYGREELAAELRAASRRRTG
jgi:hypothetical protein